MNIETLQWDTHLCNFFGVSKKLLPEIRSSSEVYGVFAKGLLEVVSDSHSPTTWDAVRGTKIWEFFSELNSQVLVPVRY